MTKSLLDDQLTIVVYFIASSQRYYGNQVQGVGAGANGRAKLRHPLQSFPEEGLLGRYSKILSKGIYQEEKMLLYLYCVIHRYVASLIVSYSHATFQVLYLSNCDILSNLILNDLELCRRNGILHCSIEKIPST